jgi:hypothetical protein
MIKTNFEIPSEEKERIISLHENATKRLYMKEADENVDPPTEPKKKIDLSPILKQDAEGEEGVRFNMPLPTSIVPGSTLTLDMIYNEGVMSYISEDGTMFNVPEKNQIEQSGVEELPWIYDINDMILRQNKNIFYIPSFDKNNLGLVWIICTFDKKTNRFVMIKDGVKPIGKSIPAQD